MLLKFFAAARMKLLEIQMNQAHFMWSPLCFRSIFEGFPPLRKSAGTYS